MKQTQDIMGMPVTVQIEDSHADLVIFDRVFAHFRRVDERYSTYKHNSEISKINRGLPEPNWSDEMKLIMDACEQTKQLTYGYFNINNGDTLDPSGLVKGWAIQGAARILHNNGFKNFYVDAGGDIQVSGKNSQNQPWQIGIRNPQNRNENVKVINLSAGGVATSGTYIRGQHIYNPHKPKSILNEVAAITVVGPDIYNADRFATAAFAMGNKGIEFIESLKDYEAYSINTDQVATMTSGFEKYVAVTV